MLQRQHTQGLQYGQDVICTTGRDAKEQNQSWDHSQSWFGKQHQADTNTAGVVYIQGELLRHKFGPLVWKCVSRDRWFLAQTTCTYKIRLHYPRHSSFLKSSLSAYFSSAGLKTEN